MNAIPLPKRRVNLAGRTIKWLALALGAGIIGVYTFYHVKDTWRGPYLELDSPSNFATVEQNPILVAGQTHRVSHLTINNQEVLTTEEGHFSQKLLLAPGYNIINLTARDRFGRSQEQQLELIYQVKTDPLSQSISLLDGQKTQN